MTLFCWNAAMNASKALLTTRKVLFTTRQSAEYLCISQSTFERLVADKRIPPGLKISDRLNAWHIEDLDAYIEQCRAERSAAA